MADMQFLTGEPSEQASPPPSGGDTPPRTPLASPMPKARAWSTL